MDRSTPSLLKVGILCSSDSIVNNCYSKGRGLISDERPFVIEAEAVLNIKLPNNIKKTLVLEMSFDKT